MKPDKDNLNETLKAAPSPQRDAQHWESFPARVSARLRTQSSAVPTVARGISVGLAFAISTACLVIGLAAGWTLHPSRPQPSIAQTARIKTPLPAAAVQPTPVKETPLVRSANLYRDFAAAYPNRLQALFINSQGIHLILAERVQSVDTPLLLQLHGACASETEILPFAADQLPSLPPSRNLQLVRTEKKQPAVTRPPKPIMTQAEVAEMARTRIRVF